MKRAAWVVLAATGAAVVGMALVAILLAESALRPPWARRQIDSRMLAVLSAISENAQWRDVEIRAADGVVLQAWWLTPRQPAKGSVIVLHGVADSRAGALGHGEYLVEAGYAVLLPDLRGHGESGGDLLTYGVLERLDTAAWFRWMHQQAVGPVYGIGISLGAAILLQSLPESEFAAVVAESPFSCFNEIAKDRLRQFSGGANTIGDMVHVPVLTLAFQYVILRHGVDLSTACPEDSLKRDARNTPVLLVHGTSDTNIRLEHSRRLASRGFPGLTLWEVADAGHVGVLARAGVEYRARVLEFFGNYALLTE